MGKEPLRVSECFSGLWPSLSSLGVGSKRWREILGGSVHCRDTSLGGSVRHRETLALGGSVPRRNTLILGGSAPNRDTLVLGESVPQRETLVLGGSVLDRNTLVVGGSILHWQSHIPSLSLPKSADWAWCFTFKNSPWWHIINSRIE